MIDKGEKALGNTKDPLEWEEISTEHLVSDEWIDFRRSAYRFPDGRVFEPFYTYSRRDYVVIVASDAEGRYLCVRQFRLIQFIAVLNIKGHLRPVISLRFSSWK